MSDEPTITGPEESRRGGYIGSAFGLAIVLACGLMMFWILFVPIAEPKPPVFVSLRDSYQISYFFLAIGAGIGWLIFLLSGRQRRLAAARASKERINSPVVRSLVCALGLGWVVIASYGALGGAPWYSATILIAFLSVAPLGFFIWHVGYSTRERDRRLGTRYPVKRGGYE